MAMKYTLQHSVEVSMVYDLKHTALFNNAELTVIIIWSINLITEVDSGNIVGWWHEDMK